MPVEIKKIIIKPIKLDISQMKLGKLPVVKDARTFKLANFLDDSKLPKIPDSYAWNTGIKAWGVMKNDEIGDCTIAAAGHLIMGWSNDAGKMVQSNADIPTAADKQRKILIAGASVVGVIMLSTFIYVLIKRKKR